MAQINMATEDWVNAQGFAKEGTIFHYMGSVDDLAALNAISEPSIGDVYNVKDSGANYVWSGTPNTADKPNQIGWDKLAETIAVSDSFTSTITNTGDEAEKAVKSAAVYTALSGKVDKETGKGLSTNDFTDAHEAKLDAMVEIDSVNTAQLSVDAQKKLSVTAIDKSIVTGLSDELDKKVDKVDGYALSKNDLTDERATKLDALATIKSIDTAQLALDANGKLSVSAIAQSVVTGLADALAGKADKVDGKGLSTEDFTTELKTKLEGLANVKSVDANTLTLNTSGQLSVTAVDQSIVTGLSDSLDKKVDKKDGYALSKNDLTDERATKLDALATIKSVEATQLAISTDGKLSVTAVDSGIVTGLSDALAKKVDKVDGYSLTKNDFTDALKSKLDSLLTIKSVEESQLAVSSEGKLSVTAIAQSVVTNLTTDLTAITTDITNMCNGTKEFTGLKLSHNGKFYKLAVAENSIGQATLYLEEIA